jgi:hypothetical protein
MSSSDHSVISAALSTTLKQYIVYRAYLTCKRHGRQRHVLYNAIGVHLLVTGGKSSARKAMDTLQSGRDRLGEQASRLTSHQAQLLGRLRKIRSVDLQEKAGLLLAAVVNRSVGNNANEEKRDDS